MQSPFYLFISVCFCYSTFVYQREMQKDHQRIKELEIRNEHQQKILKRKTEEVSYFERSMLFPSYHVSKCRNEEYTVPSL